MKDVSVAAPHMTARLRDGHGYSEGKFPYCATPRRVRHYCTTPRRARQFAGWTPKRVPTLTSCRGGAP
eukprot:14311075-Alexandrium_andersonii.AAC.1